ncbi:hypothetical protein GOP47_0017018 [Adiantum capillus-veneris]|uniref:Uncharacterized protein n=1 Tax=Adiantum capillus-veneris TaxID=13818 RepID=A0A9D4UJP8_ADICA|nr:hypothetical protein GOP47_0017018 [Adiantum capillus-veneris]
MTDEELEHGLTLIAFSEGRHTLTRAEMRKIILQVDSLRDRFPDDSSIERFLDRVADPAQHQDPADVPAQNTGTPPHHALSHSPRQNPHSAQPAIATQSLRNVSHTHSELRSSDNRLSLHRHSGLQSSDNCVSPKDMELANEDTALPLRRSGRDRIPTAKAKEYALEREYLKAKYTSSHLKERQVGEAYGSMERTGSHAQTPPSSNQSEPRLRDSSCDNQARSSGRRSREFPTTHNASTSSWNPLQMQEASSSYGRGRLMPEAQSHKASTHKNRNIHNTNHPLHESAGASIHDQMQEASSHSGPIMPEARCDKLTPRRQQIHLDPNHPLPDNTGRNSWNPQMQETPFYGGPHQLEAQHKNSLVNRGGDFIDPSLHPFHESASLDRSKGRTSKKEETLSTNARSRTQDLRFVPDRSLALGPPYGIATQSISRDSTQMNPILETHRPSQNTAQDAAIRVPRIRLIIKPPKPPAETAAPGTMQFASNADQMYGNIGRLSPGTKRAMQDFPSPQSPSQKAKMKDKTADDAKPWRIKLKSMKPSDREAARQDIVDQATNYNDIQANERRQPIDSTAQDRPKHKSKNGSPKRDKKKRKKSE